MNPYHEDYEPYGPGRITLDEQIDASCPKAGRVDVLPRNPLWNDSCASPGEGDPLVHFS